MPDKKFKIFSRKFDNFQGPTMVFQGIFKIPTTGRGGWVKAKLYTTFVNVVKNANRCRLQS